MPTIHDWITLYTSPNRSVRLRAAKGLLDSAGEIPLELLIDILVNLAHDGFGAKAEKALLIRRDPDLPKRMIELLDSEDSFVREVACNVLGQFGDNTATPHLLRMFEDQCVMVRRAAGFGLANLNDISALNDIQRLCSQHRDDDPNVVFALECALKTLQNSVDNR